MNYVNITALNGSLSKQTKEIIHPDLEKVLILSQYFGSAIEKPENKRLLY